jgi:hypothetical protein
MAQNTGWASVVRDVDQAHAALADILIDHSNELSAHERIALDRLRQAAVRY